MRRVQHEFARLLLLAYILACCRLCENPFTELTYMILHYIIYNDFSLLVTNIRHWTTRTHSLSQVYEYISLDAET